MRVTRFREKESSENDEQHFIEKAVQLAVLPRYWRSGKWF